MCELTTRYLRRHGRHSHPLIFFLKVFHRIFRTAGARVNGREVR